MRRRDSYGYGSDDGYGDEMDEEEMRMMMRDMSPGERRMYMEEMEMGRRGKGGPPGMRDPRMMRDMDPRMMDPRMRDMDPRMREMYGMEYDDEMEDMDPRERERHMRRMEKHRMMGGDRRDPRMGGRDPRMHGRPGGHPGEFGMGGYG